MTIIDKLGEIEAANTAEYKEIYGNKGETASR